MSDTNITQQSDIGGIVRNTFGEHYLFTINRNLFKGTDASTVFRSYFGESLFDEDVFYIIAGTDSGLLYQYIKAQGTPKGSRYLFLELPSVLALLEDMKDPKKELVVATGENWLVQAGEMEMQKYALMGRLTLLRSLGVIHGHYSHYPPFWREIKRGYDAYIENISIIINLRPFIVCQLTNLTENQIPATCLKDTFRGKTAVVLAGGPSLDELLPWVRQHRANLLVIAVSRISRSLLQAGIRPNISVSVDPQAFNLNVCKDILELQDDTLLVNSYHLSPNLLASWGGKKVFIGSRYPWPTPLQPEYLPSGGGTTVTNSALDIAVKTGVTQIILGGVDFCFAQQGHTHASGTVEHAMGSMPQRCELQVETNDGRMADTANGYLESAKHMSLQAQDAMKLGCRVINPAPGSMRLPHVEYISMDRIQIESLEQPARETLDNCVPLSDKNTRIQLYKEELGEVNRIMKELRAIKKLSGKGLNYNNKVYSRKGSDNNLHNKNIDTVNANKVNDIEEQLSIKYVKTVSYIKQYDVTRFTSILRLDLDEIENKIQNNKIYFQALLDTSNELLGILHSTRSRILSRLEEEKTHPKIKSLLNQWQYDQQPGRAIFWAKQHANVVSQLPKEKQQALREFQNTFDDTVEAVGQDYILQLKHESKLSGITSRAREQFLCGDQESLLRILASLQKHHDQKQAVQFIPLVNGYLAELYEKTEVAIYEYQKIIDGPTHLDALTRQFDLHTKNQDWNSALEVLEIMSGISPTYSPMYAELLYSTGDVDTAIETYTKYLLANPEDLNTMMKLGKIFLECGSEKGVEWSMSYILSKDPDNHTAQKILNNLKFIENEKSAHI